MTFNNEKQALEHLKKLKEIWGSNFICWIETVQNGENIEYTTCVNVYN